MNPYRWAHSHISSTPVQKASSNELTAQACGSFKTWEHGTQFNEGEKCGTDKAIWPCSCSGIYIYIYTKTTQTKLKWKNANDRQTTQQKNCKIKTASVCVKSSRRSLGWTTICSLRPCWRFFFWGGGVGVGGSLENALVHRQDTNCACFGFCSCDLQISAVGVCTSGLNVMARVIYAQACTIQFTNKTCGRLNGLTVHQPPVTLWVRIFDSALPLSRTLLKLWRKFPYFPFSL